MAGAVRVQNWGGSVPDVMVNYRTADARFGAAATFELLALRFGKHRMFLDNQSIAPGASYVAELWQALESISVLLVMIGPEWLDDPKTRGRRLIERDDDWVRREIRRAIERDIHIIPVLLDGCALPDPAVLPQDIRALVGHQAVAVHHDHLGEDVGRLADHLATLLSRVAVPHPWFTPPKQLPARLTGFVGRERHLAQLDEVAREAGAIAIVCGIPGVGKTALATHWAHRAVPRFSDGQLHVNLRGFDRATAANPGDVLRDFLTALGVPAKAVPDTVDARAALYRSLLADRRVLVLLDNVCEADQVRPLLPGGRSSFVVLTSRTRLPSLAVREGAQHIALEVLAEPEARVLLAERLKDGRLTAEPATAAELLGWCAGLPLALSMVGALADQRPGPLARIVGELAAERNRLDALDLGDEDLDLRSVFSWSYNRLSSAAQRLFRLLGTHPGPDIGRESCVSLGHEVHALNELVRSNLVSEYVPGRLSLHDLLRIYAAEQAHRDATEAERDSVPLLIADHYLRFVTAAARRLELNPRFVDQEGWRFDSYREALSWCEAEADVIPAVVEFAARHGLDSHLWRIVWMCSAFLRRTGRRRTRVELGRAAVAAAARAGDELAWATATREFASALARIGEYDEASTHLATALCVFEQTGDRFGRLQVHLAHTRVLEAQGRYEDALPHARKALELAQADDQIVTQADALIHVGHQLAMLERYREALPLCTEAVLKYEATEHLEGQANCLLTMGMIYFRRGDRPAARSCYERAAAMNRRLGDRYWEAVCLDHLGDVHLAAAHPVTAAHYWREALAILEPLGHPDAGRLHEKLAARPITWPAP